MELSLPVLSALLRDTLTDPRGVARRLMAMGLPMPARWMALALIAALSSLLAHLTLAMLTAGQGDVQAILPGPVPFAALQCGVLVVTAGLVHHLGRWRGGRGRFADALLLVVWLQFVLLCLQLLQLLSALVLPPLANIIGILGMGLFFWLLTCFVAELHGFPVLGRVFLAIVLVFFALAIVLAMFLGAIIGAPPGV